ncbi:uncharacterized protein LOC103709785 [Phoenix dactylifera]|uniref:Uncharacterized protein LOC103709785 n=1 Tax=Phoenix dactylifera TaxID=42345 RepID=A0A8B7C7Q1_PHODC|nr:uncharacterized protein LOC103709785 [Phoenix dactylifera]
MAMHAGIGLSKVLLLVGAGFTGSIMLRNGRLSDILSELQDMLKGLEKSAEKAGTNSELSDALSTQVRRLSMEVRQLASARPVTVISGNSGQAGNMTSLIVPAATLGALGYGYMWWKGVSLSDLMYVTKRNMANAVSNLTKHLEQVSDALAKTKRHLTQRIEGLDGKLDEQKEISGQIKQEVTDACGRLENIGFELDNLQRLVWGLDEKMNAIEDKQNFACAGVMYLVRYAEGKGGKMPDSLQDGLKGANRRGFNAGSLKGLQHITAAIESGNFDKSKTESILQNEIDSLDNKKGLSRTTSIKC